MVDWKHDMKIQQESGRSQGNQVVQKEEKQEGCSISQLINQTEMLGLPSITSRNKQKAGPTSDQNRENSGGKKRFFEFSRRIFNNIITFRSSCYHRKKKKNVFFELSRL